jgi:N-acetylmuramoyl-L-alanine amidase
VRIAMSSGHSTKCQGANGYINEVAEATRVVERTAEILMGDMGVTVYTFSDTTSTDSNTNLNKIVDWHNSLVRDWDVSVHFNAYETTNNPMGTECLYVSSTGQVMATTVANKIASVGFINRGPKKRTDLFVLNNTEMPCVLVEVCFVDSRADVDLYEEQFEEVCRCLAEALAGEAVQPGPTPPDDDQDAAIIAIAESSEIATYAWKDRGVAPAGYINGFALAWAQVVRKWQANNPAVLEMAKADTNDDSTDALSLYRSNFQALGMSNSEGGIGTLRHLFALMLGHGMRESSGQHCCGTDDSAAGAAGRPPDEIEAGLFQTSYNAHTCCPQFDMTTEDYEDGGDNCEGYFDAFAEGVTCDADDWRCYGSGAPYDFQLMCKNEPAYAMETCALVLRNRCNHYGPIKRKETELRADADELLLEIQSLIMVEPPVPVPEPDDLEERVAALEADVEDLDRRVTILERGMQAATAPVAAKKKPPKKGKK